jgi:hypothetical protein
VALAVLGLAATLTAMPAGPAPAGARAAGWTGLLDRAHDLGPSHAAIAEVLVALRAPRRPASLLGWAARQGLRVTWFRGQPTVLLAARPAGPSGSASTTSGCLDTASSTRPAAARAFRRR